MDFIVILIFKISPSFIIYLLLLKKKLLLSFHFLNIIIFEFKLN